MDSRNGLYAKAPAYAGGGMVPASNYGRGSSNFNLRNFGIGAGIGGIGTGLLGMFGEHNNPSDAAMPYINQIPGAIDKYYSPFINAGTGALPNLSTQYGNLLNNPGGYLNQIGEQYQQSPGFKFALDQALQGAGHAAAAGGMAGSPAAQQQAMQIATQLGNEDYYNWLNHAENLYGMGLEGEQGLVGMGMQAGTNLADQIANILSQKANLAYAGTQGENQAMGSNISNIMSGLATLAAFIPK